MQALIALKARISDDFLPKILDQLLITLTDAEHDDRLGNVRQLAVQTLEKLELLHYDRVIDCLLDVLKNKDHDQFNSIRKAIVQTLGSFRTPLNDEDSSKIVDALLSVLMDKTQDSLGYSQQAAAEALASLTIPNNQIQKVIRRLLVTIFEEAQGGRFHKYSEWTLQALDIPVDILSEYIDCLLLFLKNKDKDPYGYARKAVIQALGALKTFPAEKFPLVIEQLLAAVTLDKNEDPSIDIRTTAAEALRMIQNIPIEQFPKLVDSLLTAMDCRERFEIGWGRLVGKAAQALGMRLTQLIQHYPNRCVPSWSRNNDSAAKPAIDWKLSNTLMAIWRIDNRIYWIENKQRFSVDCPHPEKLISDIQKLRPTTSDIIQDLESHQSSCTGSLSSSLFQSSSSSKSHTNSNELSSAEKKF